jgi:hypothetical protein
MDGKNIKATTATTEQISEIFKDQNQTGSSSSSSSTESKEINSTARPATVNLFDIHLGSLVDAPKLKQNTSADYEDWKRKFEMWATSTGCWDMINKSAVTTAQEADEYLIPYGLNASQRKQKYLSLHQRLWGIISIAVNEAMGSALLDTIAFEQKQSDQQTEFLTYNCNYLWQKVKNTFEARAGSATIKCFEELINFRYEEKENPLQFNQRFESIIHRLNNIENDVILPGQRLSEGMKLALQIRALPRRFDVTVQAILSTQIAPTCNHLVTALQRQYENNYANQQKVDIRKDSALYANAGTDRHSKYKSKRVDNRSRGEKKKDLSESEELSGTDDEDHPPNKSKPGNQSVNKGEQGTEYSFGLTVLDGKQRIGKHELILDSGSSRHVVGDQSLFVNQTIEPRTQFKSFTGTTTKSGGVKGTIRINDQVTVGNVSYVPDAKYNLLSLPQLLDNGAKVIRINKRTIILRKYLHHQKHCITVRFTREAHSQDVWKLSCIKPSNSNQEKPSCIKLSNSSQR